MSSEDRPGQLSLSLVSDVPSKNKHRVQILGLINQSDDSVESVPMCHKLQEVAYRAEKDIGQCPQGGFFKNIPSLENQFPLRMSSP